MNWKLKKKLRPTKWMEVEYSLADSDDTVASTSLAIQNKLHRCLVDFENHLDEPLLADFYNVEINEKFRSIINNV